MVLDPCSWQGGSQSTLNNAGGSWRLFSLRPCRSLSVIFFHVFVAGNSCGRFGGIYAGSFAQLFSRASFKGNYFPSVGRIRQNPPQNPIPASSLFFTTKRCSSEVGKRGLWARKLPGKGLGWWGRRKGRNDAQEKVGLGPTKTQRPKKFRRLSEHFL